MQRGGSGPWRSGHEGGTRRAGHGGAPVIGVTADLAEPGAGTTGKPRAVCPMTYCRAVAAAGGAPVIVPPILSMVREHASMFDGFVLIGGDDPRTEPFGKPTHPKTTLVHPERQEYETALLRELAKAAERPVLGVCLGMQMMALVAGGELNQHLPDTLATAERHTGDKRHGVRGVVEGGAVSVPGGLEVTSHHHQAVADAGRMRVVAVSDDGVIEAIDDPARRFYVGVQWHPERTPEPALGAAIFARLVEAARG